MTALLFVTVGTLKKSGLLKASLVKVTWLVMVVLNRTTARAAISATTW